MIKSPVIERETEPPNMDAAERARHDALRARGYGFWGWHVIEGAWLYQRRFFEHEDRDAASPDKCCVNVWRRDHRDLHPDHSVSYTVEVYFEGRDDESGTLELGGFPAAELLERLPGLEERCLHVWDRFSRKHFPEATEEMPNG